MTPAARIATTLEILDEAATHTHTIERTITHAFRRRRYMGSADRRHVRERIYHLLRHHARLSWWAMRADGTDICYDFSPIAHRKRMITAMALQGLEVLALFGVGTYAPPPLEAKERTFLARLSTLIPASVPDFIRHTDMPESVFYECPEWLWPQFMEAFGSDTTNELTALNVPAPLHVRCNPWRMDRQAAMALFHAEGLDAVPLGDDAPHGLHIIQGRDITHTQPIRQGIAEIQDKGAQLIAGLCAVEQKMCVIDYCAGAGGKTLALAAKMIPPGETRIGGTLIATDKNQKRLKHLHYRTTRAALQGIDVMEYDALGAWTKKAHRVLVDVPCTATGIWRRRPEARWQLTSDTLTRLIKIQQRIMTDAATLVRPKGWLIYATCSLLPQENDAVIQGFLQTHAQEFRLLESLTMTPFRNGTDGFFVARLERT